MNPEQIVAEMILLLVRLFGRALVRKSVDAWAVADEIVRVEWERSFPGTEPP